MPFGQVESKLSCPVALGLVFCEVLDAQHYQKVVQTLANASVGRLDVLPAWRRHAVFVLVSLHFVEILLVKFTLAVVVRLPKAVVRVFAGSLRFARPAPEVAKLVHLFSGSTSATVPRPFVLFVGLASADKIKHLNE